LKQNGKQGEIRLGRALLLAVGRVAAGLQTALIPDTMMPTNALN